MPYTLSATKLQTYQRCPRSYYYRYELGMKPPAFFSSANLGLALHRALAKLYWDWHYQSPLPDLDWIHHCWNACSNGLSATQVQEGQEILEGYYFQFISGEGALRKPVAVEGKVQGQLQAFNLEFTLTGRYDRLDWLDDELELIDYKTGKEIRLPDPAEIDLQMGLYFLALEQRYHRSLKQLSLLYLRAGEKIEFEATPDHKELAMGMIGELAVQLRADAEWEPMPGEQCDHCSYKRYCPAIQEEPEPLPETTRPAPQVQLALGL